MGTRREKILEEKPIEASVPCRIDMGGTLDIRTFFYPLQYLAPCTVNIALTLRTTVRLGPYRAGRVKITSKGFRSAEFSAGQLPFRHPLGLMFAVCAYFRAEGIHVDIESESPPRSALGGSSSAAVALVAALSELRFRSTGLPAFTRKQAALVAQALEESVAGVPCGFQDQLAAAYGGVNAWYWQTAAARAPFKRRTLVSKGGHRRLKRHIVIAYCGIPHVSKDINGRWVSQFLAGRRRQAWEEIAGLSNAFADALAREDYRAAATAMNRETDIRRRLTPEVLEPVGGRLVAAARRLNCGARFTGAGGGGCLWAIGEADAIERLGRRWQQIVAGHRQARLLSAAVDARGLEAG